MKEGNYYRRCHKCEGIIEAAQCEKNITECQHCEFPLAPFCFFDDKFTPVASENSLRPVWSQEDYNPIFGLSAFWD